MHIYVCICTYIFIHHVPDILINDTFDSSVILLHCICDTFCNMCIQTPVTRYIHLYKCGLCVNFPYIKCG